MEKYVYIVFTVMVLCVVSLCYCTIHEVKQLRTYYSELNDNYSKITKIIVPFIAGEFLRNTKKYQESSTSSPQEDAKEAAALQFLDNHLTTQSEQVVAETFSNQMAK
jgi:hypothetical protein